MPRPDRAVVLLSGGLDSATTLALAVERGLEVHALTVRYGQRHSIEIDRAQRLASDAGAASWRSIAVDLAAIGGSSLTDPTMSIPRDRDEAQIGQGIPTTYVPARNTLFLSLALGLAEVLDAGEILIGANAVDYSGYPDCRPEFLEAFERLGALATRAGVEGRPPRIQAPLLAMTKAEIVIEARRLGVNLALTVSCYDPGAAGEPCGGCDSCSLRAKGFREAGIEDPALLRR